MSLAVRVGRTGAFVLGCGMIVQGCGGLTVMPAGPSTTTETVVGGHPTLLNVHGTLADGGSFRGYIIYGSRDTDGRQEFGRYQGAFWDVVVKGGVDTRDAHFSHTLGGRALLETYNSPSPTIGLVFLWPNVDPVLQWLTPHFRSASSYKPDLPPTVNDFGELLPGSLIASVSIFRDGQDGSTLVTSVEIAPAIQELGERPPSD